jgi:hypothetical protein
MKTGHSFIKLLATGILSIAIGGCSTSNDAGNLGGAGGSTVGSGGTTPAETSASGGTIGSGGTTVTGGTIGSGGTSATGGSKGTGGAQESGGVVGTGGRGAGGRGTGGRVGGTSGSSTEGTGGTTPGGGTVGTGGDNTGGLTGPTGGAAGGRTGSGGRGTGGTAGGGAAGGGSTGTAGRSGTGGTTTPSTSGGTCTASKATSTKVSGSGPHTVVVETNTDAGVSCGTIFRPSDLGGADKYPIFVWGEGGCSRNGLSNQASMGEIASWGYFVVADGPPGSGGSNCGSISMSTDVAGMAKVMIGYIDWAIAENGKSCSAYFDSLDTTKISADGFSCGGLMAMGTAGDPRMTAFGYTSSGLTSAVASYYKTIHTPVKILLGGSADVAYTNGMRDYDEMVKANVKVLLLSKNGSTHGGDLSNGKGEFNTVNLAWLNWQLKGDTGATGKGLLVGADCKFCKSSGWEFKVNGLE